MDPLAVRAASRLEAIGRHVVPSGEDHLERHPTAAGAASRVRLAPGGGPGTLTVVDNRTGKKYEIPVQDGGFVSSVAFKAIKAGGDGSGLRMFDPGYMNTAPCKSRYPTSTATPASFVTAATPSRCSPRSHPTSSPP